MTEQLLKMKVTPKKRLRSPNHWSFFFVDDTGKVFYFDKVKGLIIFLLLLLVVCVITTAISVKIALKRDQDRYRLRNDLEAFQKEIAELKEENETLLLKLIHKKIHVGIPASSSDADAEMTPEDIPLKPDELTLNEPVKNPGESLSDDTAAGKPADATAPEQPDVPLENASNLNQFEVNNFFVSHTPETNKLNVQFKLLKISGGEEKNGRSDSGNIDGGRGKWEKSHDHAGERMGQ